MKLSNSYGFRHCSNIGNKTSSKLCFWIVSFASKTSVWYAEQKFIIGIYIDDKCHTIICGLIVRGIYDSITHLSKNRTFDTLGASSSLN